MANPNSPFARALFVTFILFLSFSLVALVVPADPYSVALRVLLTFACVLGIYRWGPTAWRVYRNGASAPHEQGILAIVVLLLGIGGTQVYSAIYIVAGRPDWMTTYHFSPFLVYLSLIGVVFFIVSTRVDGERHSPVVGAIIAFLTALSVAIAGLWPKIVSAIGPFLSKLL